MGKLVERSLPSFFGGVSRQPTIVRKENQVENQTNALSSVATGGFEKRPCTQHIAALAGVDITEEYFTHFIDRSATEQHAILIDTSGSILAYNAITGASVTVTIGDTKRYFLVENSELGTGTGVVEVDGVDFEKQIKHDDTQFDWGWQLSDATTGRFKVEGSANGTDWNDLETGVGGAASGTFSTTVDAVATGDHNYIRINITTGMAGATDTITIWATFKDKTYLFEDVAGPEDLAAVTVADHTFIANKTVVTRMAEADSGTVVDTARTTAVGTPPAGIPAPDGEAGIYKIIEDDNAFTAYYVDDDATDALWVEVADPNAHNAFDASSLPHSLVRNADGTFTFQAATWEDRAVGDETITPEPPFIGKQINDVVFFRNRLGFLADENEFLGRIGLPFNMWPEKAVEQLDGDPIDRKAATNDINILRFATVFRKILFSTSDRAQFELSSTDAFTPITATFDQATNYPASVTARPVSLGDVLYFASAAPDHSTIYEYFLEEAALANTAADISKHVDDYIPIDVLQMAADTQTGTLFVLTTGEQNAVYVYRTFISGNEKLMSSWSKYTFGATEAAALIHGMAVLSGFLVLVIERDDGNIYLEQMPVDDEAFDTTMGYIPLIDQRDTATGTYDSTYDYTYWDPTWRHNDDAEVCLGPGGDVPGRRLTLIYPKQYKLEMATVLANETVILDDGTTSQTYTAHATTTTTANREFDISGNDIADAGELATCINDATDGHPTISAVDNGDGSLTLSVDDPVTANDFEAPTGTAVTSGTVTVTEWDQRLAARDDHSAAAAYMGRQYTSTVELSKQHFRDKEGAVLSGRLQMRDIHFQYEDTGFFTVQVTALRRDARTYNFTGRVVGDDDNVIDDVAIADQGIFKVPVRSRGDTVKIEVINSTPFPHRIVAGSWRGFFNEVSRQG